MIEQIVGTFLKSGPGAEVLAKLQSLGLSPAQATSTVGATAEEAKVQGLEELGGFASMLSGGGDLNKLVDPIAQAVAGKVGISAETARTAVAAILPKLVELLKGRLSGTLGQESGLGSALGSLLGR